MDVVAVHERSASSLHPRGSAATIAIVSILAAVAFSLMRAGTALPYPEFTGACQRLHDAGLTVTSRDWFCSPIPWTSHAAYTLASLLLAIGFVFPCAVLAATGRRATAFLPLVLAPIATYPGTVMSDQWWGRGTWAHGTITAVAITLAVMAAPVAAVAFAMRKARRVKDPISDVAFVLSGSMCAVGVGAIALLAHRAIDRHFASLGGASDWTIVPVGIAVTIFGALLGPDRRWWPWALAPTAILLSMGPSLALIIGPERLLDLSGFGLAVPLFAIGLVASAWRPLARKLTQTSKEAPPPAERTQVDPSRIRPIVVVNAVAVALMAISFVAYRADPLPVQLGTSLPTFIGPRILTEDLRTKLDLRETVAAMDAYRAARGTYRGFGQTTNDAVTVETASRRVARVAAVSESGAAYCLQRTHAGLAYGRALPHDPHSGRADVADAVAACASTPWTSAAVRRFPIATMCIEMDPGSDLICRMVQALMANTLRGA